MSAAKTNRRKMLAPSGLARSSCTSISEEERSDAEEAAAEPVRKAGRRASCAVDSRYQNHLHRQPRLPFSRPNSPPAVAGVRPSMELVAEGQRPRMRGHSMQLEESYRSRLSHRRETLNWTGVRVSFDEDSGKVENENMSADLDPLKNIGKEVRSQVK